MRRGAVSRRALLRYGAATAVVATAAATVRDAAAATPDASPRGAGAGTDAGGYEVLANAFGFGIDIPGCEDASKNIREIHIDELSIDAREMTTGTDVEYRLYGPGAAHWGSASFTSAVTLGASKDLRTWFNDCARGSNIRKNITVTIRKKDGTAGRSFTLTECFPTQWSSVNFDTSSTVQCETLTVKVGRIEFRT